MGIRNRISTTRTGRTLAKKLKTFSMERRYHGACMPQVDVMLNLGVGF
jgi:hypothetical protein